MEKMSAAMTSGIWFTYKLFTISTLPFALSPLGYFYFAYRASVFFAPDWSSKWRRYLDLRGKYFMTQNRLQMHAEAVSAYQVRGDSFALFPPSSPLTYFSRIQDAASAPSFYHPPAVAAAWAVAAC